MRVFRPAFLVQLVVLLLLGAGFPQPAAAQRGNNPMLDLFRALDRGFRNTAEEIEQSQNARDQMDIRPSQRPEDNRNLIRATELLSAQRWSDGVEVLQFLLDQPTDAFSFRSGQRFISLQADVERMLRELPDEARRIYQTQYSPAADKLLEEARSSQNETLLVELSNRFLLTPAGQTAQELLIQQWISRGEFSSAAQGLRRLLPLSDGVQKAERTRRLAVCLAHLGDSKGALEAAQPLNEEARGEIARMTRLAAGQAPPPATQLLPYPDRNPTIESLAPLPTPRWSVNLVERFAVDTRLRSLQADLRDAKRALLPTNQPLVIGNRLAFRSLRSLQLRDLRSGALVWERRAAGSPEEKAAGADLESAPTMRMRLGLGARYMFDEAELGEHHQLTSLMYRDGVFASLSSDGQRLFSVEDHGSASFDAPALMWGERPDRNRDADWATNVLTAYDVETGRVLWRVGGPAVEEEFSTRMAGTFFFGPPLPDDGELLAIGERDGEVQLISLAPQTGEENWSLPLAVPGNALSQDVVRRQWACQPVVAEGLILCPTTTGWFTAVQRHSRRLAWTARFAPRTEITRRGRAMAGSVQVLLSLNDRWQQLRPMVHNGYVLLAPPELPDESSLTQPMLFCVELASGRVVWDYPKGEGLYVAGIHQDGEDADAIVVGANSIEALKLGGSRQSTRWKLPIKDQQRPSGRGIVVGHTLWLPLDGDRLLKYDLQNSRELEEVPLQLPSPDLGNLTLANGELVSLTYQWLAVFPTDLSRSQLAGNPLELARADLGQVRQLLLSGKPVEADARLAEFAQKLPADDSIAAEQRNLQWNVLVALAGADVEGQQEVLDRLTKLAASPVEQRVALRLTAEALRKRQDTSAAARAYVDLLEHWPLPEFIREQTRDVRIDGWIAGRLRMLRASLAESDRNSLDAAVRAHVLGLPWRSQRQDQLSRALQAFPVGAELELELAEGNWSRQETATAFTRWQRVRGCEFPEFQIRALSRLGDALEQRGWRADALATWKLVQTLPSVTLPGGDLSVQLAGRRVFRLEPELAGEKREETPTAPDWIVEPSGTSLQVGAARPVLARQRGFQALDELRVQFDEDHSRLLIEAAATGKPLTSLPLRQQDEYGYGAATESWRQGALLLVMHGGVVNAVAWPDGSALWTFAPDLHGWDGASSDGTSLPMLRGPGGVAAFKARHRLGGEAAESKLISSTSSWNILLGTRHWTALDTLTGDVIWRQPNRKAEAEAAPLGESRLIVAQGTTLEVLRADDGAVDGSAAALKTQLRDVFFTPAGDLVTLATGTNAEGRRVLTLARRTLLGETQWSHDLPTDATLRMVGDQSLFWTGADNQGHVVSLESGTVVLLPDLPPRTGNDARQVEILQDARRYYILRNEDQDGYTHFNVEALPFRGVIACYEKTGKPLWTQTITAPPGRAVQRFFGGGGRDVPLNLVLEDFEHSPLLLFVGEQSTHQEGIYHSQLRIRGIDKLTGENRIDWNRPAESGGFMDMQVNLLDQTIDLRTFETRLRLRQAAAAPGGNSP